MEVPGQPSYSNAAIANPVAVIGPQYCCPYPVHLAIARTDGNFVVTDTNGNILFKGKNVHLTSIHRGIVLPDGAGNPMVTLKKKAMTAHHRWQVLGGESTEAKDLIFSAKTSSTFNSRTKLSIFLANNTEEEVPDFKVKGNRRERACTIYGNSSTIIAQMHEKSTAQSASEGKVNDSFLVTVYPNIDYAFIVVLIMIFYEIDHARGGSDDDDDDDIIEGITEGIISVLIG